MSENCQGAMTRGFPVGETEHTVVKVKGNDETIRYILRGWCTECRVEERVEGINYSCVSFTLSVLKNNLHFYYSLYDDFLNSLCFHLSKTTGC